jgi:hypothetical protein
MLTHKAKSFLQRLAKPSTVAYRPAAAFATKKDVKLDAKWEALAAKEIKGKDVRETLVRETNEQMLIKPLYT